MYRPELNLSSNITIAVTPPTATTLSSQLLLASSLSPLTSAQQPATTTMATSVLLSNSTKSASTKVDCAKECPCGVPVIPVPDQWLEVMVTGGFKVWHIIFIIIAFVVTTIVVYCCFHRCRIPRTKQEIEADLMRMNITNKFRDYLQEFPNEPTTFIEALKKVQELEEKSEKDDAQFARDSGARKRMGWLKLKGKDKQPEPDKNADVEDTTKADTNKVEDFDEKARQVTIDTEPMLAASEQTQAMPAETKKLSNGNEAKPEPQPKQEGVDETAKVRLQQRRRKQKPNLSRSKRAREPPPVGESIDKRPSIAAANEAPTEVVVVDPQPQQVQLPKKKHKDKVESRQQQQRDTPDKRRSDLIEPKRIASKHRKLKGEPAIKSTQGNE